MPNSASGVIIGHLGRDPETKTINGTLMFKVTMAVNTGYGEKKTTTWWNVTVFGKKAEALERFNLTKGTVIGFIGEPSVREYTDKDDNKRFSADFAASDFILLGEKSDTPAKPKEAKPADNLTDDEIPW